LLFGASYYPEYQPYERLQQDIALMREAGFNWVRMGDSIWSLCEPADGQFSFGWLERVLDMLDKAGIKVVLVTPTYAIPPWLHRKHPEIMAQYSHGRRAYYGGRQNVDITHPAYRFYAERIIRNLLKYFAQHPTVLGFQLDNETGTGMLHNPSVFQKFIEYLKEKFTTVDRLNDIWGLTYWSHRLHDWADLWTPDGNTTPGYDLEWRRFQSSLTTDFIAWQAGIVREYLRPDQFITHDLVGGHGRPDSDRYQIAKIVDVISENLYYATQDSLDILSSDDSIHASPDWMDTSGVWSLYLKADLARSGRQSHFLVTETNALSIGGGSSNFPAYDGQWRLAAYTFISRGASGIAYWHWHTLHYGYETYWGGILNHDLEPNRCYREICRIGSELRKYGDLLNDLSIDAEVALIYSYDSRYALEFQPCLTTSGSSAPDPRSYQRIFNTFYRSFFDAGAQITIVHPSQEFETYPILVAAGLYISDNGLLDRLVQYAENGGHLILTFRSGYADEYARARWQRAPGRLRAAVGASYQEYSNLLQPVPLRSEKPEFALPPAARAEAWIDGLIPEGATVVVRYDHHHFQQFAAVVSQSFGRGRVTYIGTLPNRPFGRSFASWAMAQTGLHIPIDGLPEPVRVTTARSRDGRKVWFLTNWSPRIQRIPAPQVHGIDLLGQKIVHNGDSIELSPWDACIIMQE
jgi:beta-galactosidase